MGPRGDRDAALICSLLLLVLLPMISAATNDDSVRNLRRAATNDDSVRNLRRRLAFDPLPYFSQGGTNPLLGTNPLYPNPLTNPSNLVYLWLVVFVLLNFLSPVIFYIYRVFLVRLVKAVTEKAKELSVKISERISDAGRRYSERMRA
jgi:hypothetical protein